jgi:HD-like signal output (HDOD) protein
MRVFELADLREGMVVGRDVVDRLGRRLIAAGVTLTERHLKAFRTWGIASVEVVTDDAEPSAVVDDARRQAVAAELAPLFRRVDVRHPVMAALFATCVERRARFTAADERRTVFSVAPDWDAAVLAAGDASGAPAAREGSCGAWVRGLGTLPSLPDVYYRLTEVLDQPRSSARDIASVIEDDLALAARVLRLVNSSFYGFPGRIDAIPQALSIIGTEEIKNLALATSVFSLFKGATEGYVTMRSFWGHSIACGVAARVIAAQRRDAMLDSMFIGGLLHDIGALTLCVHRGAGYTRAASMAMRDAGSLSQAERHVFGYDHAEVGEALLDAWNLPLRVRKTVAHCEDPQRAPSGSTEAATVHVANLVTVAMQLGSSGEVLVPPLAPQAWETLRLDPEALALIVAEVDRAFADVARVILKDDAR